MDRDVVETDRSEFLGVGGADLRGSERQPTGVVAERSRPRVETRVPAVVVLGVVGQFVWCALGTEVVGVRASSVVALVRRGDDRCEQLALLPRQR